VSLPTPPPADCPLSPREYEVTLLLAQGLGRDAIAEQMGITASTLRSFVFAACEKLRVHNAAQLVAHVYAAGWMAQNSRAERAEEELAAMILQLHSEQEEELERRREAVTPGQALYLRSFDRWLREPGSERRAMERALCLRAVYYEASWTSTAAGGPAILPPWERLGRPQGVSKRRPQKVFALAIAPAPADRA
jgi:DNA-binding CsgD family transcriptional regulator